MSPWPAAANPAGPESIFFVIWGLMMAFMMTISLATFGLMIWALIDAVKNPNLTDNERLLWILIIALVGFIGPILYPCVGRTMKPRPPAEEPAEPIY